MEGRDRLPDAVKRYKTEKSQLEKQLIDKSVSMTLMAGMLDELQENVAHSGAEKAFKFKRIRSLSLLPGER